MARILIIDDDDLICSSVKTILEKEGYEVDTSLSGESGIEKVKGTNYDLIYLDINIPGMNSLATFRAIKSIKKDAIVCILTGMADESMSEYLLLIEEGAIDKVIRKPIDKDMLLKITSELVENKGSRKKILIVDDDDLIEEAFGAVLKNFDYDLSFAKSGKEATGLFRQGKYSLVFLDLNLPDIDGRELLINFRLKDKNVKICIMSGYLSRLGKLLEHHDQSVTNIMFCMKPVSREEIVNIVKGVMGS